MLRVIQGDITKIPVDAIVNAANSSLLGGGGVDGAIHRAGGKAILEECEKLRAARGGCKVGEAVVTTAGRLPAKWVIHTVGPVWNGGANDEDRLLASCYANSLKIAVEYKLQAVSFPNISTGIYRFPKERAAPIAIDAAKTFLAKHQAAGITVVFVCFDLENYNIYRGLLE